MASSLNDDSELNDLIFPYDKVLQITRGDIDKVRHLINKGTYFNVRKKMVSFISSFPDNEQNLFYLIYLFVFMRLLDLSKR